MESFRVAVLMALGTQIMPSRTGHKIWGPVQTVRLSSFHPRKLDLVPGVPVGPLDTNVPACPASVLHLHPATSVPEGSPGVTRV